MRPAAIRARLKKTLLFKQRMSAGTQEIESKSTRRLTFACALLQTDHSPKLSLCADWSAAVASHEAAVPRHDRTSSSDGHSTPSCFAFRRTERVFQIIIIIIINKQKSFIKYLYQRCGDCVGWSDVVLSRTTHFLCLYFRWEQESPQIYDWNKNKAWMLASLWKLFI